MTFRTVLLPLLAVAVLASLPGCAGYAPTTPAAPTKPAFPFNVGKTWTYQMMVTNAQGQSFVGNATLEFTQLDGTNAAFKLTGRVPTVQDLAVDLRGDLNRNPYFDGERVGATTVENISVPAGTFAATKETVRVKTDKRVDLNEVWYDQDHGLLKLVSTSRENDATTISVYELK
jgi:hypothetical protein